MESNSKKLESDILHHQQIEFAKILGQQTDFKEILRLVAHQSTQFLRADVALILMLNPDTRETMKTIVKDGKYFKHKEYRNIHIHVGGWIVKKGKPFVSHNIRNDDRFVEGLFDKIDLKSVAGVPLIIEGIIFGALILLYKDTSQLNHRYLIECLENMAAISAPFLRNMKKIRPFFDATMPEAS
jgi:GAF domain-containing protein